VVGRQSTGAGYLFTPPPFTPPKRNVNVKSEMLDRELWSAASDEDETELEEEQEVIGFSF
jgi:hypothetical protein